MDNVGMFLKQKRKEKKLTQAELAQMSGVSVMSIRRYESNERSPKTDELAKLGNVLGFDVTFHNGVGIIEENEAKARNTNMKCVDYDELDRLLSVRGISRRQLATMIGISPDTLAGSFRRKGRLKMDHVWKIAECLGVSAESLSSVSGSDLKGFEEYSVSKLDAQLASLVNKLNTAGYEKLMDAVQVLLMVPEFRKE